MAEGELRGKQQRFVEEYLKDLNASAAYLRAGYKSKNSDVAVQKLLVKGSVQAAIQAAKAKRKKASGITAQWVLTRIKRTIIKCENPEEFDASNILKGLDLLGRHLGMWEKAVKNNDSENEKMVKVLLESLRQSRTPQP